MSGKVFSPPEPFRAKFTTSGQELGLSRPLAWTLVYRNDPKFWDRYAWANSADPEEQSDQGLHCFHSVCIIWTHYSMAEPHSSNFWVITTNSVGVRTFRMDGWVRFLRPFNSISVILRRWKDEHEKLCAMKRCLGSERISPPAGFEPSTPWSEVGSANRSATRTLPNI